MKKLIFGTVLLAWAVVVPVTTMAGVEVGIGIGINLPPPVVFEAPPAVIAMPDANGVYVVPDAGVDIFFWNGWWWRPWEGRWYRSPYYDRGWAYYNHVPVFYYDVDPGWRGYYREHRWYGHPWNYERIPHERLQQNWRSWNRERHWERQGTWGVQGYQPRPRQQMQELRRQRQVEYQRRPEVQRHQQQLEQSRVRQRQRQEYQPQYRHLERRGPEGGPPQRGEPRQVDPERNRKHPGSEENESRDGREPGGPGMR